MSKATSSALDLSSNNIYVPAPSYTGTVQVDNNSILLLGGAKTNELYLYNIEHNRFKKLGPIVLPTGSVVHEQVAFVWPQKDISVQSLNLRTLKLSNSEEFKTVIYFGGMKKEGSSYTFFNDLYEYSVLFNAWRKISPKEGGEVVPPAIHGHAAVYRDSNDTLVVHGGAGASGYSKELYEYSFKTNTWRLLKQNQEHPLFGHNMVLRKKKNGSESLVIFGGHYYVYNYEKQEYEGKATKEMHEYDFETETWNQIEQTGDVPAARNASACVLLNENLMLMFGGDFCDDKTYFNDLAVFNLETKKWTLIPNEEENWPSKRYGHVMHLLNPNKVLVMGGQESSTGSNKNDAYVLTIPQSVYSL